MDTIWFDPRAGDELVQTVKYYESQAEGLGDRFAKAVKNSLKSMEQNPAIHSKVNAGCRKCRVVRFPYNLIFREHEKGLQIVAVVHMKRRPDYWEKRV